MSIRRMSTSTITKQERYANMSAGVFSGTVEYLVIAGGGAGGGEFVSGGGGAGGYRCSVPGESSGGGASAETPFTQIGSVIRTLTVGAGGAGIDAPSGPGQDGDDSVFGSITSFGGGAGQRDAQGGRDGGSGGGSGRDGGAGGSGTANQGFDGGGVASGEPGGGGGASEVGTVKDGGDGVASSITGSSVTRGGGGGGGGLSVAGAGGAGGGGTGSATDGNDGSPGTQNTGGGGGGMRDFAAGGNGGSGVVIFTVPTGTSVSFTVGVTQTSNTVSGKDVYTVTAAGPTDEVTIG